MTTTYAYDTLGRLDHVTYPEQYHDNAGNPARKTVTPSYDTASRMTSLNVNNVGYASQVTYNAASQITSLGIGSGSSQLSENYSYDSGRHIGPAKVASAGFSYDPAGNSWTIL